MNEGEQTIEDPLPEGPEALDAPEAQVAEEPLQEQPDTPGAQTPQASQTPQVAASQTPQAAQPPQSPHSPQQAPRAASLEGDDGPPGGDQGQEDDEDVAEIEGDLDELAILAGERDEYLALAQRTQADFENYRKRVARESAAAQERGVAKLAKELLPALDNLDRALDAAATDDPLLDGVRLVRAELSSGLARVGIESFGIAGDTFDPVEHEAVAQQPVEGAPSGSVVEVYQPGYRLGANVIRPARVLVAA
jgi:molecular chaperone GrpE